MLFTFHLFQELKLNTLLLEELEELAMLLFHLASDLRKEDYRDYYIRDFPKLFDCAEEISQISEGNLKFFNILTTGSP